MTAGIYCRRSKKETDNGVAESETSVGQQEAGARAFIAAKGWTFSDAHLYIDDGVSGALFLTRPEFQRMLRDAEAGAFRALVIYDLDRFGRHGYYTMMALNTLADCGVTVYDYSTGQAIDVDTFEGSQAVSGEAFGAQQYQHKCRKRGVSVGRRKVEAGLVAGGLVFGYDNVEIGKKQKVRRINEEQAAVVREIYARFDAGQGARSIAQALNNSGALKPRAQKGRPDGWSVSTVRAVLERPLYRGDVIYGRSAKAYGRELGARRKNGREKGQIPKPEETWFREHREDLRIIDAALAARVDARRIDRRNRYKASLGRADGRMPEKAHGRYLLSGGLLICPVCNGHFEARKWPWKGHPAHVYICATRRRKPGICTNPLALPITETDETILSVVEAEVLSPKSIDQLLALLDTRGDDVEAMKRDRDRLKGEIDRLVATIIHGDATPDRIAREIRDREVAIKSLDACIRAPREAPDRARLRAALERRTAEWKTVLRGEPKVARMMLRRLMGPLTLWDESTRPEWLRWEATAKPGGLLDGLEQPSIWLASPSGFEPESRP